MSTKRVSRTVAVVGAVGIVSALAVAPAIGASTDSGSGVKVVNTETVQVYMSPDGKIDSQRVYEQLALSGKGKVDIANPISTSGLRNLDGFGGFKVKDGKQIVDTTVDGETKLRSVSDFKGQLPLDVKVAYELDGKPIGPHALVGKSGHLKVTFTVENVTGKQQQVSVPDGKGGTTTKTEEVVVPMVGSLDTGTPASFTNVKSGQANLAGDGEGGTKLSFTMTLFPPIGTKTATFGYEADVKDAIAPRVEVSALPINPLESPTFSSAATSYQGGADTGAKLADGASQIDSNLLKLRDGATQLVAGLIQLRDGAGQLSTGLNNDAVPGSKKLADGAGQLSDGLGKLDTGAGQLSAGSKKLAAGTGDAYAGSKKLQSGASQLSGGLNTASSGGGQLDQGAKQLLAGQKALAGGLQLLYAGIQALPTSVQTELATDPQYQALLGALGQVIAGIGTLADQPQPNPNDNTLLGGLNGLKYGLRYPGADCAGHPTTQCGVLDGVSAVKSGIDAQITGSAGLSAALTAARTSAGCVGDPVCSGNLDAIIPTLTGLPTALQQASDALGAAITAGDTRLVPGIDLMRSKISTGVSPATCVSNPSGCGAREALLAVQGGIPQLVSALTANIRDTLLANIGTGAAGCDPTATLQCGANATVAGTQQLAAGVTQLAAGLSQLQAGGVQLSSGAGDLASGLGQIDGGANDLSAGAKKLAAGAGDAKSGGRQVADGATQLSTGLGTAADGSLQLFSGLQQAAGTAPQLPEGAQRLSSEGTKQLVAAGKSTAASYGEMVSVMKAGAERAQTESMAFGAPAGATGLTAYSYIITEATGEDTRNVTRTVTGVGLLAALGGLMFYRRRSLV